MSIEINKDMSDKFIAEASKAKEVAIYLMNGIKLTGKILEYDDVAIRMTADSNAEGLNGQLVYKSAISTIKSVK